MIICKTCNKPKQQFRSIRQCSDCYAEYQKRYKEQNRAKVEKAQKAWSERRSEKRRLSRNALNDEIARTLQNGCYRCKYKNTEVLEVFDSSGSKPKVGNWDQKLPFQAVCQNCLAEKQASLD